MFYTQCYEQDKICKDKVKEDFEDTIDSFDNSEQRQKEENAKPKHLLHEKKFAQLQIVFETLSTKQDKIDLQDLMIELFTGLKKKIGREYIVKLLNKGIRKGSFIGVKLLHTYQAIHSIDIKGRLKPNDEKEYLDTMMTIIFCPMCPFIELSKKLNMKEDINDEYYMLMHKNKTLIINIVHNYFNHKDEVISSEETKKDITVESKRRFKELMAEFENDPVKEQIHNGVVDSLYNEFKVTKSKLCDPWKYLTQDITIEIGILLTHCETSHKFGLLAKQQNNIALPFKHSIDIYDSIMSQSKKDKGIWCSYLRKLNNFIDIEKKQQEVIFTKVIDAYNEKTNKKSLSETLKANQEEKNAAKQLEKDTLHFLKQIRDLLNLDEISDSLDYDYSVFTLERLLKYMENDINKLFEKLLKLSNFEGKQQDGVYNSKLMESKQHINNFVLDIKKLSKNIKFRFSLYKQLHPIQDNEDELNKLINIHPNGNNKQTGGSTTIENQLKQQLENAKLRLHELENEEHKLRQMRGGIRKSRQFTRKQRGGNLSSSLKQYPHKENSDSNIKTKEGGKINKDTVEHFSKIQQLESELNTNKFKTYKEMENTYNQLLQLKQKQLKKESNSCLVKQMMTKIKDNNCNSDCLRQLQTNPTNDKIQCGCKSMPKPFNYKNC